MENIYLDAVLACFKSILIYRTKPCILIKIATRRLHINKYAPSNIPLFIAAKPAPETGIIPLLPGVCNFLFNSFQHYLDSKYQYVCGSLPAKTQAAHSIQVHFFHFSQIKALRLQPVKKYIQNQSRSKNCMKKSIAR
jgi:hypothetical protein